MIKNLQRFTPMGGGRNTLLDCIPEVIEQARHCEDERSEDVAIQKKIDVKAGLLRKQGLLFTRNDELASFNCVINLNNNFRKQVSVFEACFLS